LKDSVNFVQWKHVSPCSDYLNEVEQYKQTIKCSSEVFTGEEIRKLKDLDLPECYVIHEDAPVIFHDSHDNYIPIFHPFGYVMPVLGLYSSNKQLILLVEHVDLEEVYRHEIQHFLLDILEKDADGGHVHDIWKECEPPTHSASKKAKKLYSKRDLSKEDILMSMFVRFTASNRGGFIFSFDLE